MNNIIIIPNNSKDGVLEITEGVAKILSDNGAEVFIDAKYGDGYGRLATLYTELPESAELIIVIGGDGSVIDASVIAVELDIPVLGVNLGNIGYLAEVETNQLSLLKRLFTGEYTIEEKMLLSVKKDVENGDNSVDRFAVNDVIISHESYLGIAEFTLMTDTAESVKYRADGMILSTPAGSTAYSLSAGGPIMDHGINAILATPICPHSFFNRSIIFNENSVITVRNTGKSALKISIDGRLVRELDVGEKCVVMQAKKRLKMLAFNENSMFSALFAKMQKIENM